MSFHVGQKVVCVEEPTCPLTGMYIAYPKNGVVYTICGFRPNARYVSVWLEEIVTPVSEFGGPESGFRASRFRPLTETKQTISFTEGAPKDSENWDNRKRQKVRA